MHLTRTGLHVDFTTKCSMQVAVWGEILKNFHGRVRRWAALLFPPRTELTLRMLLPGAKQDSTMRLYLASAGLFVVVLALAPLQSPGPFPFTGKDPGGLCLKSLAVEFPPPLRVSHGSLQLERDHHDGAEKRE